MFSMKIFTLSLQTLQEYRTSETWDLSPCPLCDNLEFNISYEQSLRNNQEMCFFNEKTTDNF